MPRSPTPTRQRLLDTAADHFQTVGYYNTDSNRIARDAGYSPQTFYRHFENKRAIFLAVYIRWSGELLAAIDGADIPAAVRAIIAHHRTWGVFRASLIALDATDETVRAARVTVRKRQLRALQQATGANRDQILYAMWCCERVADGIARQEHQAFGISAKAMTDQLAATLTQLV